MRYIAPPEERFWALVARTDDDTECWIWQGTLGGYRKLYGQWRCESIAMTRFAHRWAFFFTHGRWPAEGMEIDHACAVPMCVNPSHLDEVTHKQNMNRSWLAAIVGQAEQTHCKRGHPLFGPNLKLVKTKSGGIRRRCHECSLATSRRFNARWGSHKKSPFGHAASGNRTPRRRSA